MSFARKDLFGDVGSDITSSTYLVADAAEMTLELDVDSATTVVVQGSNQQGFRTTFAEDDWSTLTTIVSVSVSGLSTARCGGRSVACAWRSSGAAAMIGCWNA